MTKRIITILVITLALSLVGATAFLIVKNTKKVPLHQAHLDFAYSKDCVKLTDCMTEAETLYQTKVASGETRLTTLQNVIMELDSFEKDLNTYLTLSSTKNSTTNKLSNKYQSLTRERNHLISNYNEYIVRMKGNINIEGNATKTLYNQIFDQTVDYVYKYNDCFKANYTYIFSKVYKPETIKRELYSLYSAGVSDLMDNISNHQFENINLIEYLNNKINLNTSGNVIINSSIDGGEFSVDALNFKKYYNLSNTEILINTFKTTTPSSINPETETSSEKLAIYYINQLLEV